MTRVSSFGHNQSMINQTLRNQERLFTDQRQVNSGKKSEDYRSLSREAAALLGAKSVMTRTEKYIDTAKELKGRLAMNNLNLETLHQAGETLRETVLNGIASDQTSGFGETLNQLFSTVKNALNSRVGGVYLFGGTRSDTPPLALNSLADLVAAPSAASAFQNNQIKPTARIDDNITMEHGLLADDIGTDLLQALKNLADFNAGASGPIEGKLTATQRSFLEGEIATIKSALDGLTQKTVENGIRQNRVEQIKIRHEDNKTFLAGFISDKEDVDMAATISKLNNDQVALEASYRVLANLTKLSLLDFI
jgi:flagellar hook-associated protein 3 FlgL